MTSEPATVAAQFEQALEHYRNGRYEEANRLLGQALRAAPGNPQLWNLAAASAKALGQLDGAERCLRRAVAVAPDYAEGHYNLGLLAQQDQRLDQAVAAYREALRCEPRHARALNNLSDALLKLDQVEEAIDCCRRALAIDPAYARAYHNLGRACAHQGRFEDALAALRQAIALAPEAERGRYYRTLAYTKLFSPDDPDLAAMEQLASNMEALPAESQTRLHFALGKAYGDLGRREGSFAHLAAGNLLQRRLAPYDEAGTLRQFERIRAAYTPALLAARAGAGHRTPVPVFIVGMPRSGSTLVEQILASHPQLHGSGECDDFQELARMMRVPGDLPLLPDAIATLPDGGLKWLGENYLARLRARAPQAARISDKNLVNFTHVGLIHLALPQATFIHTRRDPVDTCLSCYSHLFEGSHPYAYDLAELGRYWRAYDRLMAHWREVLPPGVMLELQYEELVEDLEGQARRLLAHCDLAWDAACLAFHQAQRPVHTASLRQVRQPIFRTSVRKWRAYGKLLQPLLDALGDAVPAD
ncbi:MAG: sulfotransferase [Nevskia sp.]|nr:sulfotransferase [Nevskia sp.]